MLRSISFCLSIFCLLSCGTTVSTAVGSSAKFSRDAESNYKIGIARMEDNLYQEAVKYFTFVKDRFPYSKYASLSDLRIADTRLRARQYTEAVDQYKRFIRLHPAHDEVPYATYRIGYSYYKQIPADWFLVPPSYEKDLSAVEEALKALLGYQKAFPTDKNFDEANKLTIRCKRKLADHELYVANFYEKRGKWRAVVLRLEEMRTQYLGVGLDREIFSGLVEGYSKLDEKDKACSILAAYKSTVPNDPPIKQLSNQLGGCANTAVNTTPTQ